MRDKITVEEAGLAGGSAFLGFAKDFHHLDGSIERDCYNIRGFDGMSGLACRLAVDSYMAVFHQFGRLRAMLHKTGADQPSVDALRQLFLRHGRFESA